MAAIIPAIVGAVAGGATSAYAASQNAKAVDDASRRAYASGTQAADIQGQAGTQALQYAQAGQAGQQGQYQAAANYAAGQRAGLASPYQGARDLGQSSLARYQAAVAGGDPSGVYQDPAFAFRQSEVAGSANALASRAGLGTAPGGWAQYNAGLASQEYQAALDRLLGLSSLGTQATSAYAGLDANAFNQQQRIGGAQAEATNQAGQYNSLLAMNRAVGQANARQNLGTNLADYDLQRGNALAQGVAGVSQAGESASDAILYAYLTRE